jgi:hypothetical protein
MAEVDMFKKFYFLFSVDVSYLNGVPYGGRMFEHEYNYLLNKI